MSSHRIVAGLCALVALVAYIATGRIARRSPHYGGGTVVLSWIGLLVPCIAWIAMLQGHFAIERAVAASPDGADGPLRNRSRFRAWVAVYVIAIAIGAAFTRR